MSSRIPQEYVQGIVLLNMVISDLHNRVSSDVRKLGDDTKLFKVGWGLTRKNCRRFLWNNWKSKKKGEMKFSIVKCRRMRGGKNSTFIYKVHWDNCCQSGEIFCCWERDLHWNVIWCSVAIIKQMSGIIKKVRAKQRSFPPYKVMDSDISWKFLCSPEPLISNSWRRTRQNAEKGGKNDQLSVTAFIQGTLVWATSLLSEKGLTWGKDVIEI